MNQLAIDLQNCFPSSLLGGPDAAKRYWCSLSRDSSLAFPVEGKWMRAFQDGMAPVDAYELYFLKEGNWFRLVTACTQDTKAVWEVFPGKGRPPAPVTYGYCRVPWGDKSPTLPPGPRFVGAFSTEAEAAADALDGMRHDDLVWVGENEEVLPEKEVTSEYVLDGIVNSDTFAPGRQGMDWPDWHLLPYPVRNELETNLQAVVAEWLDKHNFRPAFTEVLSARLWTRSTDGVPVPLHPPGL